MNPTSLTPAAPASHDLPGANVRFIMVNPSHPGNVGATARALKTMGFGELYLVSPRMPDATEHPDAIALASGAQDVLAQAVTCAELSDALHGITLSFALTARQRALAPPNCDIREAAGIAAQLMRTPGQRVAIVLGAERAGLTNAQIDLCHRTCHIPANPAYRSLNVSQAAQLAAWEFSYACRTPADAPADAPRAAGDQPAPADRVLALMAHWEQALVAVEFLDPAHPKKLMPRMRHLFSRSALTQDEVDMLRGLCTAMLRTAAGPASTPDDPA